MTGRLLGALAALLVLLMIASLLAGTVWLRPGEVAAALGGGGDPLARLVVLELRLPRVLLAALVGAVLGLAGAVLQGLLRNPLAESGLLGIAPAASLGAVAAIYYGAGAAMVWTVPAAAIALALLASALVLALARGGGTLALVLAGAAVSSLAGAGVSLALNRAPDPYAAYQIMTWLMGSLVDRGWAQLAMAAPFVLVGAALLGATARSLDLLALGEPTAESLGADLRRTRLLAVLGTALGVGAATSVAGAIGFVGLVAPHLVRPLVGHRPGATLAPAALAGAVIVLAADDAVKLLRLDGPELALGVLTALVGAPFFLWLVLATARRRPA